MFIQTEDTPNPATLKFLPGREVMGDKPPADFPNADAAQASPLAAALFAIEEVSAVFFGADFIAVSKAGGECPSSAPSFGDAFAAVAAGVPTTAVALALASRLALTSFSLVSTRDDPNEKDPDGLST